MKKILIILLFPIASFAQTDTASVKKNEGHVNIREVLSWLVKQVDSVKINRVKLDADVINNTTALQDAGLSFPVVSGVTYRFRFFIIYTSAATTTGSRWTLNGPATSLLHYYSNYTLTATSITNNQGLTAYGLPAASNASSVTTSNVAIIEGVITPSANGTLTARFASETSSAITAKINSYVEYQIIN